MHKFLVRETANIYWVQFKHWMDEVKDQPEFEVLKIDYEGWEDAEVFDWSVV